MRYLLSKFIEMIKYTSMCIYFVNMLTWQKPHNLLGFLQFYYEIIV